MSNFGKMRKDMGIFETRIKVVWDSDKEKIK